MQEQAVSDYWSEHYNPVTDLEGSGHVLWEDPNGDTHWSEITIMDDSTWWWDTDNDGWFNFATTGNPMMDDVNFFDGYHGLNGTAGEPAGVGAAAILNGSRPRPNRTDPRFQRRVRIEVVI